MAVSRDYTFQVSDKTSTDPFYKQTISRLEELGFKSTFAANKANIILLSDPNELEKAVQQHPGRNVVVAQQFLSEHQIIGLIYRGASYAITIGSTDEDITEGVIRAPLSRGNDRSIRSTVDEVNKIVEYSNMISDFANDNGYFQKEGFKNNSMIGTSNSTLELVNNLYKVAQSDIRVYLLGDSGTGKDVAAQLIHQNSKRSKGPFVTVNCTSVPDNLFESEMFGHRKGGFTGANQDKTGFFEQANNGTLFLDEIASLPMSQQAKLLVALEKGVIRPVGATTDVKVDVRVISASHGNLAELVDRKDFREDLSFRLEQYLIKVPPLRSRGEDVELLAASFLRKALGTSGGTSKFFTEECLEVIKEMDWSKQGNIRGLKNLVEAAAITSTNGQITEKDIFNGINPFRIEKDVALQELMKRYNVPLDLNSKTIGKPAERQVKMISV